MAEKRRSVRFAPLQRIRAEEVTDPAEMQKLDEERGTGFKDLFGFTDSPEMETAFQGLPSDIQQEVLMRLVQALSPHGKRDFLQKLLSELPLEFTTLLEVNPPNTGS